MRIPGLPTQPLWREPLVALEAAALVRDPVYKGAGISGANGQPVLLIPGFLAGDGTLSTMTHWLRRNGYWTSRAGMRANIDCSAAAADRLAERLERLAERQGQRVAIIGQSRGGTLARVLAVRHPDLVSGIVTLGSPLRDPFAIHPMVRLQVTMVGALGSLGAPGLFKHSCIAGECCERFWEDLKAPFPPEVGYLSIYSKRDGIVDWRSCLDPAAEHLEIRASHIGMGMHPGAWRAVAQELEGLRRAESRRQAAAKARRRASRERRQARIKRAA